MIRFLSGTIAKKIQQHQYNPPKHSALINHCIPSSKKKDQPAPSTLFLEPSLKPFNGLKAVCA
jgi:hypothetical protein